MKKLIVVLAHPRTGSSLLMQTLKILGVAIIGQFERGDLPQEANPKGYYEIKEILCRGITGEVVEEISRNKNDILAIKIAMEYFINENRESQWQYLKEKQATIFITIRPPLESALSNLVFTKKRNEFNYFIDTTTFLRNYRSHYKKLAKIFLEKVPELEPNCKMVNYHHALDNPQKYVQRIIDTLGLKVSKSQFDEAVKNIDSTLYRYRQDSFDNVVQEWNRKIGADQYYNILLIPPPIWQKVYDLEDG